MNNPEAPIVQPVVTVPYGDAGVIPIEKTIQTTGLYSCIGVILIDEKHVALAHIPAINKFEVRDESIPGYGIVYRGTFGQLTEKLLHMYGNKTTRTHAYIVGGIDQSSEDVINSEDIVNKITQVLLQWGLQKEKIERRGPHDKETEWDVTIHHGNVCITPKKAYFFQTERQQPTNPGFLKKA
jgi:chemotaxis receptor (MCP) glutamine deamidase CheD